jgi:hypothetical protein
METNPGNPSAPPIVGGIHPADALAGSSVCSAQNQKLLRPVFNNGGVFLSFAKHKNFSPRYTPIVGPPISPVHRNCLPGLGAALCNLPHLILIDLLKTPLSSAIAMGIAIPAQHGVRSIPPFQMRLGGGVHHAGAPAPSCRLCLIACNSLHGDAVREPR